MSKKTEAIRFDIETKRESLLSNLMFGGLVFGVIIMFMGLDGKHYRSYPGIIIAGFFIAAVSLVVFSLLRYFTDDYLMVDPAGEYIMEYNNFFLWKKTSVYCPFKEVLHVKLDSETRIESSKKSSRAYTDFFLYLAIKKGAKTYVKKVSMPDRPGYQFNEDVAWLRDKAFNIAETIGCDIVYTAKIPPEERLKPKKEIPLKTYNPVTADRTSANNMDSDFTYTEEEKICQSCGEKNNRQNKYCYRCGKDFI
ncbi:MAG: hypothetical protein ABRQ39_16600 [Candidatus Eremiobacterota bacterium]